MGIRKDGTQLRQIDAIFNLGAIHDLTDGQLLERFATGRGEAAELAFAALVERHSEMVSRVCRAVLDNPHDAQDAFQATFLILIVKARSLWVKDSLGPWLHQVAFRTALCSRSSVLRRRRLDRLVAEQASRRDSRDEGARFDREQALHAEIDRLPARYRQVIILCDLQGHTCEEAARRLGRPVGTVKSWRSRGRERLRARLVRLGLAPSAGLAWVLAPASGAVADKTVPIAVQSLVNRILAGEVPAAVQALVKGMMTTMLLTRLRTTAVSILALAFLAAGLGAFARVADDDSNAPPDAQVREAPSPKVAADPIDNRGGEPLSLSLREAIRIGLRNSQTVRVVSPGGAEPTPTDADPERRRAVGSVQIARPRDDIDPERFRSEVMAQVRSIEQQYWTLHHQRAQKRAIEEAVRLAGDLVTSLEAKKAEDRGGKANLAEARQRHEDFQLDLLTRTSAVIAAERRLRDLLGLPAADGRRIIPTTAPVEAKLDPDWDRSLTTMLEKQPDIATAKSSVRRAAANAADPTTSPNRRDEPATTAVKVARSLAQVEKENKFLSQVIHQTTHSLARFFLEIDANYKQFRTVSEVRASAAERVKELRAQFDEGRTSAGRYLDAVNQLASAIASEALYKAAYNISIVALEEATGTLLDDSGISIVEAFSEPRPRRDREAKPASHEPSLPVPRPTIAVDDHRDVAAKDGAEGKTYSFRLTIGRDPAPFEIKATFTVSPIRPTPNGSNAR